MPRKDNFKPSALLSFERAQAVRDTQAGMTGDESLVLRWKVSLAAAEQCRRWAYENRRSIQKFKVEKLEYEDLYRSVGVEVEQNSEDRQHAFVRHTFAKGLATAITWTEARLLSGKSSKSHTKDADSVANTATDSPNKFLVVQFPNVDPRVVYTLAASLTSNPAATITVETADLGIGWHLLFASAGKADDGSGIITATYAHPQYTLEGYQNFDTTAERDVFYLWGVPKDLAQTIMDAWKAVDPSSDRPGRSATASYSNDRELVDIVLSKVPDIAANLSKLMDVACDSTVHYHFAWGYTETQLSTFLDNHNGALGANQSRRIDVRTRGDGFFDAVVEERTTVYDADKHTFSIVLTTGTAIVRTESWGWNVPKDTLEAVKTTWETAAAGVTATFEVRREDDCSFDYHAMRSVQSEDIAHSLEAVADEPTSGGVREKSVSVRGATAAELTALEDTIEPAKRKRVSVKVESRDDSLADASVTETEVQKVIAEMTSGGAGQKVERFSGDNVDPADLVGVVSSSAASRVLLELTGNPDGSLNYRGSKITDAAVADDFTVPADDAGSLGVSTVVYVGQNQTAASLEAMLTALEADETNNFTLDVSTRPGGNVDYVIRRTILRASAVNTTATGAAGVETVFRAGRNQTAVPAISRDVRKQVSGSVDVDDAGRIHYGLREDLLVAIAGTKDIGGAKFYYGHNADALPIDDLSTAKVGYQSSISGNNDGTFNYLIAVRDVSGGTWDRASTTPKGIRYVQEGSNQETIPTPTAARLLSFSVRENAPGRYDFAVVSEDVDEVAYAEADSGTGIKRSVSGGVNAPETSLPTPASSPRVRDLLNVRALDEGYYNWERIIEEVQKTLLTTQIPDTGTLGRGIKTQELENADVADLPAVAAPGVGETYTIRVRAKDDGSITCSLVKEEAKAVSETATGGTYAQPITIEEAINQTTPPALTPVQGTSHFLRLSLKEDGTIDWTKTTVGRQQMQEADIQLSNLCPRRQSYGYSESATLFEGVTALPTPSGTYYYIQQLRFEQDNTMSGILVNVDYDADDSLELFDGTQVFRLTNRQYDSNGTNPPHIWYRDVIIEYRYKHFSGASAAANAAAFVFGGHLSYSGVSRADEEGVSYWLAIRGEIVYENPWTEIAVGGQY